MKFAKIVFWCAGIWGILILAPLYFMLHLTGVRNPPPVTHPEFYYGFIGAALIWQFVFFLIATDPARFRPMMVPSMLEKFIYVATILALFLQHRVNSDQLLFAGADLVLGLLFVAAFLKASNRERTAEKVLL